jgi:hypothetical protein
VGVWGNTALVGLKSRARRSETPQCVKQWLRGPMGWGLKCSTCYSFSIWWGGEAFHELGVQSADVSALPGALPQSSMSPASAKSLDHGGQEVCGCVPVTTLDLSPPGTRFNHVTQNGMQFKTYKLFVTGIFHLVSSDRS